MFLSCYRSWQILRTWYMDSASILSMLNTYTVSFYKANYLHRTWLFLTDTNTFCPDYCRKLKYSFTPDSNWVRLEMFTSKLTVPRCQTHTIFKHIYIPDLQPKNTVVLPLTTSLQWASSSSAWKFYCYRSLHLPGEKKKQAKKKKTQKPLHLIKNTLPFYLRLK